MRPQREWFLRVPWGKMALKSHGHPDGEPVFLVHGRQDSLAVFDPLIAQMSEEFYYVALDMPGNGLSDAFPHVTDLPLRKHELSYTELFDRPPQPGRPFIDHTKFSQGLLYTGKEPGGGPKLQRFHFLYAMELAILHLGWDKFIFMGHSMGCEQGLFFNVIYPGRITRMILLDAGPTLMRMQVEDNEEYQMAFFDKYYENYRRECFSRKKYSFLLAKQAISRVRELTEAQCAHILSRNFQELGLKYGSHEQLLNGHPIEAGDPNNSPKSKTGQVAVGAQNANMVQLADKPQNATEAEIKNEVQKANKKDYEPQNTFEAAKEFEADTLDTALNEYYQHQISNGPTTMCASFVEGRKVKATRKANEARNAIRSRKAIEVRSTIRARNAYEVRNANDVQNADEPGNANDARNADDAHNAEDAGNRDDAQNADGVEVPHEAESFISFIERMRSDDAAGYLSWDNRLKNLAPQNYGNDYYFELFKKIPPTLLIAASNGAKNVPPKPKWRQGAKELLDKMATLENFQRVDVEGSHDVHYTHPERVLPYINAFLKDNKVSSKL